MATRGDPAADARSAAPAAEPSHPDAPAGPRRHAFPWILAAGLPIVALEITRAISPIMSGILFLFFFAAVAIAAYVGGFGPGLLATAISSVLINYYLLPPYRAWVPASPADVVRLTLFVALAMLMSRMSGALREARDRAEAAAREAVALARQLEEQAVELEIQTTELEQQTEEAQQLATDLELANTDTAAALDRAESASRAKSEFLAVMSHELRTPLNAIGGYTELIDMGLRGPVTEQQRADLERIRRAQQHLLALINDILNLERIEAGAVPLAVTDVPVAAVCTDVADLVAPLAERKGVAFDRLACDPGLHVRADADKLRQILLNLLSNAIKYTATGGHIRLECDDGGPASRLIRLRVRDTGVGIPAEKLDHVFEPFVQLDRSLTTNLEGVGLGLTISRSLARAMGGDITAESRPGAGSTFTVELRRPGRITPPDTPIPRLSGAARVAPRPEP